MKPWKSRSEFVASVSDMRRFNGATAMKPWKSEHVLAGVAEAESASMGPRR